MVNTAANQSEPEGRPPRRWFWRSKTGQIGLLVLVVVVAGGVIWLVARGQHNSDTDNTDDSRVDDGSVFMTIEEKHNFEHTKRAKGAIESVDGDAISVRQDDGKLGQFELINDTQYVVGAKGFAGERSALTPGKKVSLSYDDTTNKIQSIWVDYDVKVND